jgi:hypothetical protein
VPLDWAGTQNNLGTALQTLGEREGDTTQLNEAVLAYQNALLERTQERVPLDWATTTGNKANAERIIAELTSDCSLAQAAVADLRMAIGVLEAAGHQGQLPLYRYSLGEAQRVVGLVCRPKV